VTERSGVVTVICAVAVEPPGVEVTESVSVPFGVAPPTVIVIFIVVALVLLYVTAPLWSVQVSVPATAAQAQCVLAVPVNAAPVYVRPAGTACVVFAGVPTDGVNVAVAVSTCVYTTVPPGATFAGAAALVIVNWADAGDAYKLSAKSAHSSGASIERKRGERRVPA